MYQNHQPTFIKNHYNRSNLMTNDEFKDKDSMMHPQNFLSGERYVLKNIGYWVVYEQVGDMEWHCAYMPSDQEDGKRWIRKQIVPPILVDAKIN